jgi:SAM-dependent methyltransferase
MAEKCARVTGIDISETAIRLAGQRAEASPLRGPCFCVMDAERLGFVDETFDFVCGRAILHHLDIERSLSELERVPKHGGTAVFVEPLGHNPLINFYRKMTPSLRTVDEHPLISSDLVKIQSRFGEVRFRFFHFLSLTSVPFRGLPGYSYLLRLLDSLDQLLFRLLPFTRKYAWTIVIEMSRRAI